MEGWVRFAYRRRAVSTRENPVNQSVEMRTLRSV